MINGAPGDATTITTLSVAERARTTHFIEQINLMLLGERSAVALCALTGVLCVVMADLQVKHDVPIPNLLRMLFPLLQTEALQLAEKIEGHQSHPAGHA
jgi:hypothetical protein